MYQGERPFTIKVITDSSLATPDHVLFTIFDERFQLKQHIQSSSNRRKNDNMYVEFQAKDTT
jgi:hypothetical protein